MAPSDQRTSAEKCGESCPSPAAFLQAAPAILADKEREGWQEGWQVSTNT